MPFNLPLNDMTLQEKLAAMESLWEDLARTPEAMESPAWHQDLLDARRQRLAEGTARFSDWETAKADIRTKLS
ncbi:addiction module protein [Nitrospira sp. Kam-Ns4a]